MTDTAIRKRLQTGIRQLNLSLSDHQIDGLMEYLNLLIKWNKAYNLTAIRNPEDMVVKHLLDSLAIVPYVDGTKRIIDVGTGAGLPGIILAIINPDADITLLDSNGKKTRFLFQVKTHMGLSNLNIVNDRVEAFNPPTPFDIITSRAFASLQDMVRWCSHLLAKDGHFLAMKGTFPQSELNDIAEEFECIACHELVIPSLNEERHLIGLTPIKNDQ